jgi:hypothetical protein
LQFEFLQLLFELATAYFRHWFIAHAWCDSCWLRHAAWCCLLASESSSVALTMLVNFTAACDVVKILALASSGSIVGLSIIVLVEESLNPLAEFQIILVSRLLELGHVDMSLDSVLVERCLQNFVVFNELVFVLSLPLHSMEWESVRVEAVHNAAVDRSRGALLNLVYIQLKRVRPRKDVQKGAH